MIVWNAKELTSLGDYVLHHANVAAVAISPNDGAVPPDVLVIGDSFSAGNVWESVAARAPGMAAAAAAAARVTCLIRAQRSCVCSGPE